MTATLELRWRRGSYCARITGQHDRYGLDREFESGTPRKADGGRLKFELTAGWYETQEWRSEGKVREYWQSDGFTVSRFPESLLEHFATASAGPPPGTNGAWNGDRCDCGAEVETFTSLGFPKCAEHVPAEEPAGPELSPL